MGRKSDIRQLCLAHWFVAGLVGAVLAGAFLTGCSVEEPISTAPPPIRRKQEVKANAPEALFAKGVEASPAYDPSGRRDPFQPLLSTKKSREALVPTKLECPPLQEFEPVTLKLVGIVWGEIGPKAMVKAPNGRSYTLSENMLVGPHCARVQRIESTGVILEQTRQDGEGKVLKEEVVLRLREREG